MLLLSTDSLKGYGLNRIFKFTKDAGYEGIDLAIDPKNHDTENVEYIKSLMEEYDLPVVSIQTPASSNHKKIQEAVKMAKGLDCKIIIIQAPKFFDFKYITWVKNEIPKIRQKESISIALENAPSETFLGIIPGRAMNNILELKKFKHACLDTSRVAQKKEDLIRIYKILKNFLVHVHISNVYHGKAYSLLAEGILPMESFLTKLKQEHFKGNISLKVNPKFLLVGEDEKVLKKLSEEKKFFDTYFTNVKIMEEEDLES